MQTLQEELAPPPADQSVTAIATAYGVQAKVFAANRQLQYDFNSPEVTEYSQAGGTLFIRPEVKVYDEKQQLSWHGSAGKGKLSGNHEQLRLSNGTEAIAFPQTPKALTIISETAEYSAPQQQLSSSDKVNISSQDFQQTANGYVANLILKTVGFSGNVKAHYQAPMQGE